MKLTTGTIIVISVDNKPIIVVIVLVCLPNVTVVIILVFIIIMPKETTTCARIRQASARQLLLLHKGLSMISTNVKLTFTAGTFCSIGC